MMDPDTYRVLALREIRGGGERLAELRFTVQPHDDGTNELLLKITVVNESYTENEPHG